MITCKSLPALPPLRFDEVDAQRAYDEWGCNCGPSAIAAVLGLTPAQVRPALGDFERRGYVNVSMMRQVLERLAVPFEYWTRRGWDKHSPIPHRWANCGLVRIQWTGPWATAAQGKPAKWASIYTHWVASCHIDGRYWIFDVNSLGLGMGGWQTEDWWADVIVPAITKTIPRATGRWYSTHVIEVFPRGQPDEHKNA